MSIELGTYSQGEYVPRKIKKQKVLGSTALEFSSTDEVRPPYDTSVIFVIEDPELYSDKQTVVQPDVQIPNVRSREDFGLYQRNLHASLRKSKRRRNRKR